MGQTSKLDASSPLGWGQIAWDAELATPLDYSANTAKGACIQAIYNGGASAGNINVVMQGGNTVLFSNVPSGFILPVACSKILSLNTTATNLVALY